MCAASQKCEELTCSIVADLIDSASPATYRAGSDKPSPIPLKAIISPSTTNEDLQNGDPMVKIHGSTMAYVRQRLVHLWHCGYGFGRGEGLRLDFIC
jgi:hypothetical protein